MFMFLSILISFTDFCLAHAETQPYHWLKDIAVTAAEGGWDYLLADADSRKLYMSQSSRVLILDMDSDKIVDEISDTLGVHGVAIVPAVQRGFSSNGKESKVSIFDLKTNRTLFKLETGENPDAIISAQNEVYVFNGKGKSVTIFDAAIKEDKKLSITLGLPGKPEFAAADASLHQVYVNIEDKNQLEVIDTSTHQIVSEWKLPGCDEPTAMSIDEKNHQLFVGCHNQTLLVLNNLNGKVLGSAPIGKGVDAVSFDPKTHLILSSNGEGSVTVIEQSQSGGFKVIQTLKTEPRARTMALDLKTHKIYLPSAQFQSPPKGSQNTRPQVIPGTLKILVYSEGP